MLFVVSIVTLGSTQMRSGIMGRTTEKTTSAHGKCLGAIYLKTALEIGSLKCSLEVVISFCYLIDIISKGYDCP